MKKLAKESEDYYNLRKSGKTYREIAEIYGVTHQAVQDRIKRHFPVIKQVKFKKYRIFKCLACKKVSKTDSKIHRLKFCSFKCVRGHTHQGKLMDNEFLRERDRQKMKNYFKTKKGKNIIKRIIKEQNEKFKYKTNARSKLNQAVKKGEIKKPTNCSICNITIKRIQAHHEDYTKPLQVMWVCGVCHALLHKRNRL